MAELSGLTSVRTTSDYVDQLAQSDAFGYAPVFKAVFDALGVDSGPYDRVLAVALEASPDGFALVVKAGDMVDPPAADAPPEMSAEQLARNVALQEEADAELAKLADAYAAKIAADPAAAAIVTAEA